MLATGTDNNVSISPIDRSANDSATALRSFSVIGVSPFYGPGIASKLEAGCVTAATPWLKGTVYCAVAAPQQPRQLRHVEGQDAPRGRW